MCPLSLPWKDFFQNRLLCLWRHWLSRKHKLQATTFSVPSSFTALSTIFRTSSSTRCSCKANRSAKVVPSLIVNVTWLGKNRSKNVDPPCFTHRLDCNTLNNSSETCQILKDVNKDSPSPSQFPGSHPLAAGAKMKPCSCYIHSFHCVASACQHVSYLPCSQNPLLENLTVHLLQFGWNPRHQVAAHPSFLPEVPYSLNRIPTCSCDLT